MIVDRQMLDCRSSPLTQGRGLKRDQAMDVAAELARRPSRRGVD